ncbi:hypothetical protein HK405_011139 [Cladochytrium tenue]|nr:hypothetical protein HK405_011139 [Cladochytrium tenue]
MGKSAPPPAISPAGKLAPELLARLAFFAVLRGWTQPATGDPLALAEGVHAAERRELAERRRVCRSWCAAFSPPLFHVVVLRGGETRSEAAVRALQTHGTAAALDTAIDKETASVRWSLSERLPHPADLVRILYVRIKGTDHDIFRPLRSASLPRLHSIYIKAQGQLSLLPWLPRPPSLQLFSLKWSPSGMTLPEDFEDVLACLRELPLLKNLELDFGSFRSTWSIRGDEVALPHLTGLRIKGRGLLCALASGKFITPANIVWFSGTWLSDGDVAALTGQFRRLEYVQLRNCNNDERGWFGRLAKVNPLVVIDIDDNMPNEGDPPESLFMASRVNDLLPHLARLRVFKYNMRGTTQIDIRDLVRVCFKLPSLHCLQLNYPSNDNLQDGKEDAEIVWDAAQHFYSRSVDGGDQRKLFLFVAEWQMSLYANGPYKQSSDSGKRLESGKFQLLPVDLDLMNWDVVRYGATPDEDVLCTTAEGVDVAFVVKVPMLLLLVVETEVGVAAGQPVQTHLRWPRTQAFVLSETVHGRQRSTRVAPLSPPPPPPPQALIAPHLTVAPASSSHAQSLPPSLPPLPLQSTPLRWRWRDDNETDADTAQRRALRLLPRPARAWLRATFLPVGFPASVHSAYVHFHWLQAVETYLWSTVSVLCSQSMLASLGLADAAASTSVSDAATAGTVAVGIRRVLKDGFGEIGKLFVIRRFAGSFDSHPKTWKRRASSAPSCSFARRPRRRPGSCR